MSGNSPLQPDRGGREEWEGVSIGNINRDLFSGIYVCTYVYVRTYVRSSAQALRRVRTRVYSIG